MRSGKNWRGNAAESHAETAHIELTRLCRSARSRCASCQVFFQGGAAPAMGAACCTWTGCTGAGCGACMAAAGLIRLPRGPSLLQQLIVLFAVEHLKRFRHRVDKSISFAHRGLSSLGPPRSFAVVLACVSCRPLTGTLYIQSPSIRFHMQSSFRTGGGRTPIWGIPRECRSPAGRSRCGLQPFASMCNAIRMRALAWCCELLSLHPRNTIL